MFTDPAELIFFPSVENEVNDDDDEDDGADEDRGDYVAVDCRGGGLIVLSWISAKEDILFKDCTDCLQATWM